MMRKDRASATVKLVLASTCQQTPEQTRSRFGFLARPTGARRRRIGDGPAGCDTANGPRSRQPSASRSAALLCCLGAAFERTALPTFPTETLTAHALRAKAYDAYHSTTMEGYRITPETVDAIVAGDAHRDRPLTAQDLEASMNVQGYSHAFDLVLDLVAKRTPISSEVVLDIHEALYRPSVEAGLMKPGDLRKWRSGPIGLAGFQHVPPNHLKLSDLMRGLDEFAARQELTSMQRALLVHLEFVTIHPFFDGNGRIGRLLMNMALLSAGHPWVTVLADARAPFFRSIEAAQVRDETSGFISFLKHEIVTATNKLLLSERSMRTRSRRKLPHSFFGIQHTPCCTAA